MERKKVLYVDKADPSLSPEQSLLDPSNKQHASRIYREKELPDIRKIGKWLYKKFDVTLAFGLLLPEVQIRLRETFYEGLVTHLPYDLSKQKDIYRTSLETLGRIHLENPVLKIVVFTGADEHEVPDKIILETGAKRIIRKHHLDNVAQNAKAIIRTLEEIL